MLETQSALCLVFPIRPHGLALAVLVGIMSSLCSVGQPELRLASFTVAFKSILLSFTLLINAKLDVCDF